MRAHFTRTILNAAGEVPPAVTYRLLQPFTTTALAATAFTANTGTGSHSMPKTVTDGVIDFYLDTPQRIRLGVKIGSGTEKFYDAIDLVYPSEDLPNQFALKSGLDSLSATVTGLGSTYSGINHTHTKGQVGLGNVDNTADVDKPASNPAKALFSLKTDIPYNAKAYGAKGDGATDDTAALNTAAAAATAAGGVLFIPPGIYNTSGTVTVGSSVDAGQATLRYSGSGVALVAGSESTSEMVWLKQMDLPRVVASDFAWNGTSVGVKIGNLQHSRVSVPQVQDFERGVLLYGNGQDVRNVTVLLGQVNRCRKGVVLDANSSTYAVRQCTVVGGSVTMPAVGYAGAVVADDQGSAYVQVGATADVVCEGNTFVGTALSGVSGAYWRIQCNGRSNLWQNCRYETTGTARVQWGALSDGNQIIGGIGADSIAFTKVSGAGDNELTTALSRRVEKTTSRSAYIRAATSSATNTSFTTSYAPISGWQAINYLKDVVTEQTNNANFAYMKLKAGLWHLGFIFTIFNSSTASRTAYIRYGINGTASATGATYLDPPGSISIGLAADQSIDKNQDHYFFLEEERWFFVSVNASGGSVGLRPEATLSLGWMGY